MTFIFSKAELQVTLIGVLQNQVEELGGTPATLEDVEKHLESSIKQTAKGEKVSHTRLRNAISRAAA